MQRGGGGERWDDEWSVREKVNAVPLLEEVQSLAYESAGSSVPIIVPVQELHGPGMQCGRGRQKTKMPALHSRNSLDMKFDEDQRLNFTLGYICAVSIIAAQGRSYTKPEAPERIKKLTR